MKKAIMSILTVWILVSSMFIGLISYSDIENVQAPYIPHNPFRINSDAEFASMAGIEGWAGNGLPGNPYIIEGYDIDGTGYGYCIYIGNTTVYFEVRDCYLHEASGGDNPPYFSDSGLTLYKAQNGTLTNNTVSSYNSYGIYLDYSDGNLISCNNISNYNYLYGIRLEHSFGNNITNNNVFLGNGEGISLEYSGNNNIAGNYVSDNYEGICLWGYGENTVIGNTVSSSRGTYGIYCKSSGSNIVGNNVTNSDYGIGLPSGNNVIGNNVSYNIWGIQGGGNSNIKGNNISYNDKFGIRISGSENNIMDNNVFLNNDEGIYIDGAKNNYISGNNISFNNGCGIRLYWMASKNNITNNNIFNNLEGINVSSSSNNNIIKSNNVSDNEIGIKLFTSSNNSIYHNNIINNTNQASDNTNNGNKWDNGYPIGGNYWSDYNGNDSFKGPNQDIPGSDGIGDTPYIIDADSQDNYPLMEPFTNITFENYTVLKQGWNLISIPLIQIDPDIETVLQMIDSYYDAVQWYDNLDSNDPWKHNKIGKPMGNDLTEINESMAFWIHITNPGDTIFLYNGTQPTSNQSITLHPGWNMVGYPSLTNRNRTAALNNLTFGSEVDAVWTFDAATQTWEEIKAGDYFELGRGYWIHATQECVWEVGV